MNWYYADGSQQFGPVTEEQFRELVAAGKVTDDTLVWHEGLTAWQRYGEVRGGGDGPAAAGSAVCAECGRSFPPDEVITIGHARVCAGCKPVFIQKLKEGAVPAGQLNYAGFWIRAGAKIIDGLIVSAVSFLFMIPLMFLAMRPGNELLMFGAQMLFQLLGLAFAAGYTIFFLGRYGATPGKMACKLKVVTPEGDPISYGRATGRFFGDLLSGMICYIGYLMVAFDREQCRALHDRICNTRVIRR